MADMLVKLYNLESSQELIEELREKGIRIKRALAPDRSKVVAFAQEHFSERWADEVQAAFANNPVTCYVATKEQKLIGFACFEATAKDFFGPTGVLESERGGGVGKALLLRSLEAMQEMGYGYAIIGWPAERAVPFYERCVGATMIEEKSSGVYQRMIEIDE